MSLPARRAGRTLALVTMFAATFALALSAWRGTAPDPLVPVRFPEGALHGFLVLRDENGDVLTYGDQLVDARSDGAVESRIVFRFPDGSRHDERVVFTQDSVFRMRRYSLTQRGPAFPADLEITLDAGGRYTVVRDPRDGDREVREDTLDLPPDTYNGMVLAIAKNLPPGRVEEVHYVAFTPGPQLIGLELRPEPGDSITFGDHARPVVRYRVKPRLGLVRQLFASLLGKDPPDNFVWLVTDPIPGFVRFEGPLYLPGPSWRIELATPEWRRGEEER